jgi:hypothetical protein
VESRRSGAFSGATDKRVRQGFVRRQLFFTARRVASLNGYKTDNGTKIESAIKGKERRGERGRGTGK